MEFNEWRSGTGGTAFHICDEIEDITLLVGLKNCSLTQGMARRHHEPNNYDDHHSCHYIQVVSSASDAELFRQR